MFLLISAAAREKDKHAWGKVISSGFPIIFLISHSISNSILHTVLYIVYVNMHDLLETRQKTHWSFYGEACVFASID